MNNEAVLDKETGLVWQIGTNPYPLMVNFYDAESIYHTVLAYGRYGWRLPTIEELLSIADPGLPGHLPPGHPFIC